MTLKSRENKLITGKEIRFSSGGEIKRMVLMKNETEKAYPRQSTEDKDEEYSYLFTECGNWWYSVKKDPMVRDNCICPKCGRVVKVVMEGIL